MKYRDMVVFCLMVYLVNGCAHYQASSVTLDGELNSQLTYLPWWSKNDNLPKGKNKEFNSFDLEPGMRLTISSLPIWQAPDVQALVLPATYQWVVPAPGLDDTIGSYRRADFFFLDWLMINGIVDSGESHDLEVFFNALGSSLRASVKQEITKIPAGRYFSDLLGDRVMGEWNNPKRWLVRSAKPTARLLYVTQDSSKVEHCYTADILRRRMCAAAARDFPRIWEKGHHARKLKMTLELKNVGGSPFSSRTLSVLDGDDWFFTNTLDEFDRVPKYKHLHKHKAENEHEHEPNPNPEPRYNSDWLDLGSESFYKARGAIDAEIAVHVLGDAAPIYLPGCLSVADLEKLRGRQIKGFRRPAYHINNLLSSDKERKELLVSEDGTEFATFYFRSNYALFDPHFGAKKVYLLDPNTKKDVIVGHGDILIEVR